MNWQPYTYLLKCPNGLFYYGVKYANNKRDVANPATFWISYFTSSSSIKSLRELYSDDEFEFEIRKTFDTAEAAIKWESTVNKRLTTKSPLFMNDSYLDGRIQHGEHNGMYGKCQSPESRLKSVATRLANNNGVYCTGIRDKSYITEEYKLKLSENAKNQHRHGKIYKVVDELHLFREFESFDFPTEKSSYLINGRWSTKISYFVNTYYIPKFCRELTSKSPSATLRKRLRNKYGSQ